MNDVERAQNWWHDSHKQPVSKPQLALAPFTNEPFYLARLEQLLLKSCEEGTNFVHTEALRTLVYQDSLELYVSSTMFGRAVPLQPESLDRNIRKHYADASNILISQGAVLTEILLSAITVISASEWISSPADYDAHIAAAGAIFVRRLSHTPAERNRKPMLTWRKEILMYFAGMRAVTARTEMVCGPVAVAKIRALNVREVTHMLLVQSAVTIAEYMMDHARADAYAGAEKYKAFRRGIRAGMKAHGARWAIETALRAFRDRNASAMPLDSLLAVQRGAAHTISGPVATRAFDAWEDRCQAARTAKHPTSAKSQPFGRQPDADASSLLRLVFLAGNDVGEEPGQACQSQEQKRDVRDSPAAPVSNPFQDGSPERLSGRPARPRAQQACATAKHDLVAEASKERSPKKGNRQSKAGYITPMPFAHFAQSTWSD
jgi:hypothetical protein